MTTLSIILLHVSTCRHRKSRVCHVRCTLQARASETGARCCCSLRLLVPRQATLLAEKHGLKVCIIDPNLEKRWIPNYGVWVEEWESLDKDLQVQLDVLVQQCCMSHDRCSSPADVIWWSSHGGRIVFTHSSSSGPDRTLVYPGIMAVTITLLGWNRCIQRRKKLMT